MIFCSAGLLRLAVTSTGRESDTLVGGVAVAHALAGRPEHHAVLDLDGLRGHVPGLGGDADQGGARIGTGKAERSAAELDGERAGRDALVRRLRRIAGDQHQPFGRHVELVGGDLAHGGEDALAQLDAAGHDRDAAVGRDPHPGVELRIVADHRRHGRAARGRLGGSPSEADGEAGNGGGGADGEGAAADVDFGADRGHGVTLPCRRRAGWRARPAAGSRSGTGWCSCAGGSAPRLGWVSRRAGPLPP